MRGKKREGDTPRQTKCSQKIYLQYKIKQNPMDGIKWKIKIKRTVKANWLFKVCFSLKLF